MNKKITKKTLAAVLTCFIAGSSWAQTTFTYTGTIDTYTVPSGVTEITIEAFGAQGGNTNGGLGAKIYGEFSVTPGQVLNILVGQQGVVNNCGGADASGGGGGASYIWDPTNTTFPLIAAAGGGGNTNWVGSNIDGVDGQATLSGTASAGGATLAGPDGNGGLGNGPSGAGAGGAGWNSNGDNSTWSDPSTGGESLPNFNGGIGSPSFSPGGEGGFGGGGGATCGCGGGAGYSGGSGGEGGSTREGGGGGGSYNGGTNVLNTTGVRTGNGQIVITSLISTILTTSINVQGQGGVSTITTVNGTLQIEATLLPVNVTDGTYTWSVVNGTGTASINVSGILTASADGTVTVTATANDASGVTGSTVITISNQTAGIYENNMDASLTMYPNPSSGIVHFTTEESIQEIEVFNYSGQKMMTFKDVNQIDISSLENGVYFIKVILNNQQIVLKRLMKS